MMQRDAFLAGEGDAWFRRNRGHVLDPDDMVERDRLVETILAETKPARVLEVGCSSGERLEAIRRATGARCCGVDPSREAVTDGRARFPEIELAVGEAAALPYRDSAFDLVMFGFCLYLCDRPSLFRIAAEADRVLADGGHLAILDFLPPHPYRNPYHHRDGLWSYKMDHGAMFRWHPAYRHVRAHFFTTYGDEGVAHDPDNQLAVLLFAKDMAGAFPVRT